MHAFKNRRLVFTVSGTPIQIQLVRASNWKRRSLSGGSGRAYSCELASLQLHKPEPRHPLRLRTKKMHISLKPTCLERLAKIRPTFTQYSNPLLEPEPWEQQLFGGGMEYIIATGGTADKKKAAENFNQWLSERSLDEMVVYIDRSQKLDKAGKILGTGTA